MPKGMKADAMWQSDAGLGTVTILREGAAAEAVGLKSYAERLPDLVAAAKTLQAERPRLSLRKIAFLAHALHFRQ
jgi:hypothetical protein